MSAKSTHNCEIIDTESGLKELAKAFQKEHIIGVDLEADSMYHFREKVCLIQMAAGDLSVAIDPLQIQDLSALRPLFRNRHIKKVFHGADYDIRSLYRDFQITVNNLFDTQLACRFLGVRETSLEAVLKKWFQVTLNKKYQRKDWSQRPLPREMIAYALEDVRYLGALTRHLVSELKCKTRLDWVEEECAHLSQVRPVTNDTNPMFLHFKGAGRLDPRSLAVLETLLQYRKALAQKRNRPLFKIIRNKSLLQLALEKPASLAQLAKSKGLSPKQTKMYGEDVVSAIQAAVKLPAKSLPKYPRKKSPPVPAQVGTRVKALKNWRDHQALALEIDPALICTNAQISLIALHNPKNAKNLATIMELKKWQKNTFGRAILETLMQANT